MSLLQRVPLHHPARENEEQDPQTTIQNIPEDQLHHVQVEFGQDDRPRSAQVVIRPANPPRPRYFSVTAPLPYAALDHFAACPACGSHDYWLARDFTWRCARCEPGPDPPCQTIRASIRDAPQDKA
jgi:hypothetical protein